MADILGYSIDYITPENLAEVREMAERVGAQAVALPVTIAYYNHAGAKVCEGISKEKEGDPEDDC